MIKSLEAQLVTQLSPFCCYFLSFGTYILVSAVLSLSILLFCYGEQISFTAVKSNKLKVDYFNLYGCRYFTGEKNKTDNILINVIFRRVRAKPFLPSKSN